MANLFARTKEWLWQMFPGFHSAASYVWPLLALSGCFWMASWVLRHVSSAFKKAAVRRIFVVLYTVVLAVPFCSLIALFMILHVPRGWVLLTREAWGVVFVYIVMGAAYADPATRKLREFCRPAYIVGMAAYLSFVFFPWLLINPATLSFHDSVMPVAQGWIGGLFFVLSLLQVFVEIVQRIKQGRAPRSPAASR